MMTFDQFMAFARKHHLDISGVVSEEKADLTCDLPSGRTISTRVAATDPTWAQVQTLAQYINAPLEKEEVRFNSPIDFVRCSTWDDRHFGLYAAHAPGASQYLDGYNYWECGVAPQFADQDGKFWGWLDAQGAVVAYLDCINLTNGAATWKDAAGNVLTSYAPGTTQENGRWIRASDSADVTRAAMKIDPYEGYKIVVNAAKVYAPQSDPEVEPAFPSPLIYKFHSFLPAALAQAYGLGSTDGIYPVKTFIYRTLRDFKRGSNYPEPDGATYVYDYEKTDPVVIDSRLSQFLEIYLEDPVGPATGLKEGTATYIGMKIRSL